MSNDERSIGQRFLGLFRSAVSGKKVRYQQGKYDLDLTYITPRIIAMGFPASKLESAYRNPIDEVAAMLIENHDDHFMIWNLSERNYNYAKMKHQVLDFWFPDHTAPPLDLLFQIVTSMNSWLEADERNVAVVHCMAGLGRTGTAIASYFLFSNQLQTAKDALEFFAAQRTTNGRGVRIPSQIRYVHYVEHILKGHHADNDHVLLEKLVIKPPPEFDYNFVPIVSIFCNNEFVWASNWQRNELDAFDLRAPYIAFNTSVVLWGDVNIRCFHATNITNKHIPVFRAMFHTAFAQPSMRFNKADLDWAWKDKRWPKHGVLDLFLRTNIETKEQRSLPVSNWKEAALEPDPDFDEESDSYTMVSKQKKSAAEDANKDISSTARRLLRSATITPSMSSHNISLLGNTINKEAAVMSILRDSNYSASTSTSSSYNDAAAKSVPPPVPVKPTGFSLAKPSVPTSLNSPPSAYKLTHVHLNSVPQFNPQLHGCHPCVQLWADSELLGEWSTPSTFTSADETIDIPITPSCIVTGSVIVRCFDISTSRKESDHCSWNLMFTIQFEAHHVEELQRFYLNEMKYVSSDRGKFAADFSVDLLFKPMATPHHP